MIEHDAQLALEVRTLCARLRGLLSGMSVDEQIAVLSQCLPREEANSSDHNSSDGGFQDRVFVEVIRGE